MTPKEARQVLINALRSGEYKQAQGVLKQNDRFCCLGVACDVYRKITGEGEWKVFQHEYYEGFILDNEREPGILPRKVADFFGFIHRDGRLNEENSLAHLNDIGCTFDYIANVIEKEPENLVRK